MAMSHARMLKKALVIFRKTQRPDYQARAAKLVAKLAEEAEEAIQGAGLCATSNIQKISALIKKILNNLKRASEIFILTQIHKERAAKLVVKLSSILEAAAVKKAKLEANRAANWEASAAGKALGRDTLGLVVSAKELESTTFQPKGASDEDKVTAESAKNYARNEAISERLGGNSRDEKADLVAQAELNKLVFEGAGAGPDAE